MASSGRVVHSWSTEQSESSEEEVTAKTRKRKRKRAAKFAKERGAEGGVDARAGVGNIDFVSEKERTETAAADARWKRHKKAEKARNVAALDEYLRHEGEEESRRRTGQPSRDAEWRASREAARQRQPSNEEAWAEASKRRGRGEEMTGESWTPPGEGLGESEVVREGLGLLSVSGRVEGRQSKGGEHMTDRDVVMAAPRQAGRGQPQVTGRPPPPPPRRQPPPPPPRKQVMVPPPPPRPRVVTAKAGTQRGVLGGMGGEPREGLEGNAVRPERATVAPESRGRGRPPGATCPPGGSGSRHPSQHKGECAGSDAPAPIAPLGHQVPSTTSRPKGKPLGGSDATRTAEPGVARAASAWQEGEGVTGDGSAEPSQGLAAGAASSGTSGAAAAGFDRAGPERAEGKRSMEDQAGAAGIGAETPATKAARVEAAPPAGRS